MSGIMEDDGIFRDLDGEEVDPSSCEVRFECVVEMTTYDHDRSRRSWETENLLFSEAALSDLYEAIERDRLARKPANHRIEHVYRYGLVRKVLQITEEDFDEARLADTEAHRRHTEAESRKAAEEKARKDAEVARGEAADRTLSESLHQRFGQQTQGD